MKIQITAIFAALLLAASTASAGQQEVTITGYLPPLKTYDGDHGPNYVFCSEPWVHMMDDGTTDLLSDAWYCVPIDHHCYVVGSTSNGYGCGGGKPKGWSVPAATTWNAPSDLDAEIIRYVVDPCYLEIARHDVNPGVTPEEMVEIVKMVEADTIAEMITSVRPIIDGIQDAEARQGLYNSLRQMCVAAALGG